MRLLLDTHVLLAAIEPGLTRLPGPVAALLNDRSGEFFVSVASLWEIALKARLGKLTLTRSLGALPALLNDLGMTIVAIHERHALASVEPEPVTRDPFDRMLLAQCQVEGLKLVTIDHALVFHPLAAADRGF